jgi:hypothetical protein
VPDQVPALVDRLAGAVPGSSHRLAFVVAVCGRLGFPVGRLELLGLLAPAPDRATVHPGLPRRLHLDPTVGELVEELRLPRAFFRCRVCRVVTLATRPLTGSSDTFAALARPGLTGTAH